MDKDGAIADFKKKFKDKTKNNWDDRGKFKPVAGKYTLIEMDDGGSDDEEEVAAKVRCVPSVCRRNMFLKIFVVVIPNKRRICWQDTANPSFSMTLTINF